MLEAHKKRMLGEARLIKSVKPGPGTARGCFVAPAAFELERPDQLKREVFGPILHVLRYEAADLDRVIDGINATGYGLTLGVHTRIDETWQRVAAKARVGNVYVNRNQIGALVGIQPFGGMGLSGTGPKAGGPHYLHRFTGQRPTTGHGGEPADAAPGLAIDKAGLASALAQLGTSPMPPLESRAATLEKLAAGMDGAAAAYLGYFAGEARSALEKPLSLPGPTGERNELSTAPRGTIACVAADPAILMAQVAAAFVTGNHVVVVGNEAEALAKRFREAGVAAGIVVPVPPGSSATLDELATDPAIDGMAFAGPLQLATRLRRRSPPATVPFVRSSTGSRPATASVAPRPAARPTCTASSRKRPSRTTPPPRAATPRCWRSAAGPS